MEVKRLAKPRSSPRSQRSLPPGRSQDQRHGGRRASGVLDAGGPHQRDLRGSHTDGAFLFPQMLLDPELRREMGEDQWRPGFVDYLFLAYNTSTAFSPTDVPVLSRWAKVLMMLQATISLGTIAILAARAINIL